MGAEAEIKAAFWGIFDNIEEDPDDDAVAEAIRRLRHYVKVYPAAACLEDDFASLTVRLPFPQAHWKRIRHSTS